MVVIIVDIAIWLLKQKTKAERCMRHIVAIQLKLEHYVKDIQDMNVFRWMFMRYEYTILKKEENND